LVYKLLKKLLGGEYGSPAISASPSVFEKYALRSFLGQHIEWNELKKFYFLI
jgi:hypothetical protein